jgi:hypothetical protein
LRGFLQLAIALLPVIPRFLRVPAAGDSPCFGLPDALPGKK